MIGLIQSEERIMSEDIFQRNKDNLKKDQGTELSDYTPVELTSYLLDKYPYDPVSRLDTMIHNNIIGTILGNRTRILLEAANASRKESP